MTQCERSEHHTNDSAWIVECSFLLGAFRAHQLSYLYTLSFCILAPQTPTERTLYTQQPHDGRWAVFIGMISLRRKKTISINMLNSCAPESCSLLTHWTMLATGFLWCFYITGSQNLGYSKSCASVESWTILACTPYSRNANSSRNYTTGTPESCALLEQETIPIEVLGHIDFVVHVARCLFRLTPRSCLLYTSDAADE